MRQVNHLLHLILTVLFFPWAIVWLVRILQARSANRKASQTLAPAQPRAPDEEQYICDREQCRYMGSLEQQSLVLRIMASLIVTLFFHLACFPLLLMSPLTVPVMFITTFIRFQRPCPACKRGRLEPVSSPRGGALKARLDQQMAGYSR